MIALGIDTSNYTTSMAYFDGCNGCNCSRLLEVKEGELGLRQSDALFAHVKRLPELSGRLFRNLDGRTISAIGVSTRPRAVEGSYMPCFLAGQSQAEVLAQCLAVPVYHFSHQQGHIAASLWSAGRTELLHKAHLAWHLSGGTTELLYVTPEARSVHAERIGGTTDISAGQLIDRTGRLLGFPFPAGRAIDACSRSAQGSDFFRVKTAEASFSLSGVQNQSENYFRRTGSAEETAQFVLRSIVHAVISATRQALVQHPGLPVVFSGGVASNSLLRGSCTDFDAVFCPPEYATDNAMGIAVLAYLQEGTL